MTTFAFPAPFGLEPFFEPFLQAAAMHVPQQQYVHKHNQHQQQRRDQNNQQPRKQAAAEPAGAAKAKAATKAALLPAPVVPPCNIFETDAAYWIQVEVPGASEPEVVAHENKLVVKAAVAIGAANVPEGARPLRRERARAARYERTFSLPEHGVDADGIEATLEAGVLTIVVPKVQPQAPAPKRIKVKVGGAAGSGGAAAAATPAPAAKKSVRLAIAAVADDDDEGSVEDASDDHDDERMQA
jgi:HSP20 family protein